MLESIQQHKEQVIQGSTKPTAPQPDNAAMDIGEAYSYVIGSEDIPKNPPITTTTNRFYPKLPVMQEASLAAFVRVLHLSSLVSKSVTMRFIFCRMMKKFSCPT